MIYIKKIIYNGITIRTIIKPNILFDDDCLDNAKRLYELGDPSIERIDDDK